MMTFTEAYIREFEKFRQGVGSHPKESPAKPGAVQNVLTGVAPGTYSEKAND